MPTFEFHRLGALQGRISNRVPSKAAGRRGTRRAWKRAHPPGRSALYHYFDVRYAVTDFDENKVTFKFW